jgi:hypothetical protein
LEGSLTSKCEYCFLLIEVDTIGRTRFDDLLKEPPREVDLGNLVEIASDSENCQHSQYLFMYR